MCDAVADGIALRSRSRWELCNVRSAQLDSVHSLAHCACFAGKTLGFALINKLVVPQLCFKSRIDLFESALGIMKPPPQAEHCHVLCVIDRFAHHRGS